MSIDCCVRTLCAGMLGTGETMGTVGTLGTGEDGSDHELCTYPNIINACSTFLNETLTT